MAEANGPDHLHDLIQWGREERNLEYKRSMSWTDPATKEKLTRSVLAMANLRDGGSIVLGVERQADDTYLPVGMHSDHLASYIQDHLAAHFSEYADPFVEASLIRHSIDGKDFLVLRVSEFSELPVLCKRDSGKLRRGAMYIRSRRIPETVEVPSQVEMREILDLAIEKRERAFLRQAERLGFSRGLQRDEFLQQLKTLPEAEILKKIRAMTYWRVWIRPTLFEKARLQTVRDCRDFVERNAVAPGWQYPQSGGRPGIELGEDWISKEVHPDGFLFPVPHLERWAFFRSGQFIHHFAFPEEFIGKPPWRIPVEGVRYVNIWETLKTTGRIFEFAARMAREQLLLPACRISIELHGVDGRQLSYMNPTPRLDAKYWCRKETIQIDRHLEPDDLKANARSLALNAAFEIFRDFGWANPPKELLAEELQKLLPV